MTNILKYSKLCLSKRKWRDKTMAGYYGYSMSNNAVSAYEEGEMPLSKWTKQGVIEYIANDLLV